MLTRSQLGQRAGDGAGMTPGSSHHGLFPLLRGRDMAGWCCSPSGALFIPVRTPPAGGRDPAAQTGRQRNNPAGWEVVPSHEQPAAGLASAAR